MVAVLILIVLLDAVFIVLFVVIDSFLFITVLVVHATHVVFRLPVLAEPILCLTHLIIGAEHSIFFLSFVVENLFFFGALLLVFELVDDLLLLLPPLRVLEVVHVQLVLEVVDVGELLDIDRVVLLELSLQPLVLFLIFRLDIFNTL